MVTAAQSRLRASPFVKWAGGKGQLLSALIPLMPDSFGTYFEPFLGGGAVFYALTPPAAVLGDFNEELINCYRIIRDQPDALMTALDTHIYDRDYYYHTRSLDPATLSCVERAARFIYLNKTCFNGLYRVNRKGQFNVPFGKYATPPRLYDPDNIRTISVLLQNVKLMAGDYRTTLATAKEGDFIYLDPPYAPLNETTAQFTNYTSSNFNEDSDQRLLAQIFHELDERGCLVMLSNADTPTIRGLYDGYSIEQIRASRAINSNGAKRGHCIEVVVRNYPRLKTISKYKINKEKDRIRHLERWTQVIEENNIDLNKSINYITADQIRETSGGIDTRLMAKIDRRDELPSIFRDHNIFILPVRNGLYALVRGDGYHTIAHPIDPPDMFSSQIAFKLQTIDVGLSEMQHIDFAYNSGLLEHFLKHALPRNPKLGQMYPTIRGRKFSPSFKFVVGKSPELEARSVQVEVDAGYESNNYIILIEGKIGIPSDFIIKQLYYPYRFWKESASTQPDTYEKPIIPIFFCYDPDSATYHFWLYTFTNPHDYASIKLKKQKSYKIIQPLKPTLSLKEKDLPGIQPAENLVVPQANDVGKLLEFPFKVSEGIVNNAQIAHYFDFDPRQSQYYRQALEALGLLKMDEDRYQLTERGKEYVTLDVPKRNKLLANLMLELPIMNKVLIELLLHSQQRLSIDDLVIIIKRYSTLSGSTLSRRARTILAWFRWMQHSLGVVQVRDKTLMLHSDREPYQLTLL